MTIRHTTNTEDSCGFVQKEKDLLVDFMKYLDRRGFIGEDLQFDIEHQVETYLKQFKFKQQ